MLPFYYFRNAFQFILRKVVCVGFFILNYSLSIPAIYDMIYHQVKWIS